MLWFVKPVAEFLGGMLLLLLVVVVIYLGMILRELWNRVREGRGDD